MATSREQARLIREARRAAHQCQYCGVQLDPSWSRIYCETHLEWYRQKETRRNSKSKQTGRCIACGAPAVIGRTSCAEHAARAVFYQMSMRERRKALGVCIDCGSDELLPVVSEKRSPALCRTCYFKAASGRVFGVRRRWQELEQLFERQNGVCPYTGVEMRLGFNTALDHIWPKSRYPERAADPDNLQWVLREVNAMKLDLTHDEFLAVVRQIAGFAPAGTVDFSASLMEGLAARSGFLWPSDAVKGISLAERMAGAQGRKRPA